MIFLAGKYSLATMNNKNTSLPCLLAYILQYHAINNILVWHVENITRAQMKRLLQCYL